MTGATDNLHIHHLEAYSVCPERMYDVSNGVPLSVEIHRKFHSIYGTHTTTLMFEKFLVEEYGFVLDNFPWRQGNHEPSASIDDLVLKQQTRKQKAMDDFLMLLESKGHELVSGDYINVNSKVTIYCREHKIVTETTFHNYKRCKNGLKCCGRQQQKDKAKSYVRDRFGVFKSDESS